MRPASRPEAPLGEDVKRLVEGIALSLAQEHHEAELRGKGLGGGGREGLDTDYRPELEPRNGRR